MFNQEDTLIPFNVSQLPPAPWLGFAPHADDETFGMGGTILKAKEQDLETHLVVLTDGSKGGEADDLVEVRESEVRKVAQSLGIASLQTWSEPDRSLEPNDQIITRVSNLILKISPGTVFFPGPLEIHPDHRAAAALVWRALQRVKVSEAPPIPISYEISVQNPINMLIDITQQIDEKKKIMQTYVSQNQENNYPELVVALDKGRTFSLPQKVKFAEGFFRYEQKDLSLSLKDVLYNIIDLYGEKCKPDVAAVLQ